MGIGKAVAIVAAIIIGILALLYWILPWWAILIALVVMAVLLFFFWPAILAGIGMAAEAGVAAAEGAAMANAAKAVSSATTAAKTAHASTPVTPASTTVIAPANHDPIGNSEILKRLEHVLVVAIIGIVAYFILGNAGLQSTQNISIIGTIVGLIAIAIVYPPALGVIMKLVGIIFLAGGGLLIFLIAGRLFAPALITTVMLGVYIVAVFATWKGKAGFVVLLLNTVLFWLLLFPPLLYYQQAFRPESPLYIAAENQRTIFEEGWAKVRNTPGLIKEGGTSAQQAIQRQILIAIGKYETGVEAANSQPLGVFLEHVGVTSPRVPLGTPIDMYAELTAQAFKADELLNVNLRCYAKTLVGKEIPGSAGEIQPQSTFELSELESYPIDCILDSTKIEEGAAKVSIEATFDFATGAFLKGHFMPQEVIRDYARQGKQPLTEFGITGKDLTAVYTPGPLRVGMGLGKQPVPILPNTAFGPTLGVTFENNWPQGKFVAFKKMVITAPPGLEIKSIDGKPVPGNCKLTPLKEHSCIFQETQLTEFFPDKIFTKTLRVQTQGRSVEELLGGAPLAIRSFKVDVTYTYRINKDVDITVLPLLPLVKP